MVTFEPPLRAPSSTEWRVTVYGGYVCDMRHASRNRIRHVSCRLLASVCAVLVPHVVSAQDVGDTVERVSSTVDWQYPKPPAGCQFCGGGCFNGAAFGQDWRIRRVDASAIAGVGVGTPPLRQ